MEKKVLLERIRELTNPLSPVSIDHKTSLCQIEDIKCVALDFYGTMFISAVGEIGIDEEQELNSARFFANALEDTGFTILDEEAGMRGTYLFEDTVKDHIEAGKDNGIDVPEPVITGVWADVLTTLREEDLIEGEITPDKARLFGIEFEFRINDVWPVPDLKNILSEILDQDIKLGIISNSQYYTPLTFEAIMGKTPTELGFDPNLLVWSYKTGRKKPSPAFYQLFVDAARQQGIEPQEVLYIGNDIRKDIAPAKKVGMKTALYVGDERSMRHEAHHLQQERFIADIMIDDLHQILECL